MNSSLDSTGYPASSPSGRRVAILTGGSQGIGAGLVSGFRREGYAVVATSRSIDAADEDDYLTARGDIGEVQTARNVVEQALNRFARIDCLVNDAGVFIGKPFTDYTLDDYVLITSVNLAGFFHLTQRVIGQMMSQGGGPRGQRHHQPRGLRRQQDTRCAACTHQGRSRRRHTLAGD